MEPADPATDLKRAEALVEIGRYAAAQPILHALVAGAPGNPRVLCVLALCYDGLRDHAAMLVAADLAVGADPQSEWAHRLRSIALRNLRRPAESLAAAREAARLAPGSWRAHVSIAEALMGGTEVHEKKGAYDAAQRALAVAPELPGVHVTVGRVLLGMGEHRLARTYFTRALALDPTNSAALNNLAVTDLRGGRLSRAGRGFGNAAAVNPTEQMHAHNVAIAAVAWTQRMVDVGIAVLLVALTVGVVTALDTTTQGLVAGVLTAGYLLAFGVLYARLPAPMRRLVARPRAGSRVRLARLALVMPVVLMVYFTVLMLAGIDSFTNLIIPVWVIGFGLRLRYRLGPRLRWAAQRRRYRTAVLGPRPAT